MAHDHDLDIDVLSLCDPDKTLVDPEKVLGSTNQAFPSERFVRQSLLGRGGGGAVYRAFDTKLNREVAIKIPLHCITGNRHAERTFRREVYATSRLRHPYVVTLFDFELNESEAVLVYEFVDGETLHSWISKNSCGVDSSHAAEVVKKVALALQHAHSQNILHRDIKPSNILLDQKHAAVSASLEPRLADFGLAQLLHEQTRTDSGGQIIGSIHYIPPEVIRGSADAYSPASDIYSLGTVLYELLTGTRAFVGATIAEVLEKIGKGDHQLPSQVNPSVPRDLEAICLRAMAIDPQNRYLTAEHFAQDLDRFLSHQPVVARHPGLLGVAGRWSRRHPTLTAASVLSAIALAGFVSLVIASNHRLTALNSQLSSTNEELSDALEASRRALFHNEQTSYCYSMRSAAEFIEAGRLRDARVLLEQYGAGTKLARHRDFEWYHLRGKIHRESEVIFKAEKPLYCLVTHDSLTLVAGAASEIIVIDNATKAVVQKWNTNQGEVNAIAIDEANSLVFTSGDDGTVAAFDLSTGKEKWRVIAHSDQRAYELVYLPRLQRLFCLGHLNTLIAIDTKKPVVLIDWKTETNDISIVKALDETTLIVGAKQGQIHEIDAESGASVGQASTLDALKISAICVLDSDRAILATPLAFHFYDARRNEITQTIEFTNDAVSIDGLASDRAYTVAMQEGGFVRLSEDDSGRLSVLEGWTNEGERVYQAISDRNGCEAISVDHEGVLRKWLPANSSHKFLTKEEANLAYSVCFESPVSEGGWPSVIVGCNRGVYRHDFNHDESHWIDQACNEVVAVKRITPKLTMLALHNGPTTLMSHTLSADGKILASNAEPLKSFSRGLITSSDDGNWFGGCNPRNDTVWFMNRHQKDSAVHVTANNPHVIAIFPEENHVYWNDERTVYYASLSSPHNSKKLVEFESVPELFDVSEDGKLIAVGLGNHKIYFWDKESNSLTSQVLLHPGIIASMTFSNFGKSLITLGSDAILRCWNLETSQLILERKLMSTASTGTGGASDFTSDQRFLTLRGADNSVHLFRLY